MVDRGVNTFTFCPQVIADAIISQVGSAQGDEFGVTKLLELSLFSVPILAWSTVRKFHLTVGACQSRPLALDRKSTSGRPVVIIFRAPPPP